MMKRLPSNPVKKRTLALILACITALALMVPALAHGHHGGRRRTAQVTVCTFRDCDAAGRHVHNGVTYCGYDHEGGVCDGRCLALCGVEGCEIVGRHVHDGVTYCGNCHEAGFCDGSCAAAPAGRHGGCHHHG